MLYENNCCHHYTSLFNLNIMPSVWDNVVTTDDDRATRRCIKYLPIIKKQRVYFLLFWTKIRRRIKKKVTFTNATGKMTVVEKIISHNAIKLNVIKGNTLFSFAQIMAPRHYARAIPRPIVFLNNERSISLFAHCRRALGFFLTFNWSTSQNIKCLHEWPFSFYGPVSDEALVFPLFLLLSRGVALITLYRV